MTQEQKEKIREDFEKSDISDYGLKAIADYFLSILDKELEEERHRISSNILKFSARIPKEVLSEVLDLIHNKS